MDDRPVIVNESFLRDLHRRMIRGWIVAVGMLGISAVSVVSLQLRSVRNLRESRAEVARLQGEMAIITAEQRKVTESFVKAWENQQATASLLVSWGTYVKDRTELSAYNATHRPTEFASARSAK